MVRGSIFFWFFIYQGKKSWVPALVRDGGLYVGVLEWWLRRKNERLGGNGEYMGLAGLVMEV